MSSIWDKITGKEEVHPHDQPPTASNEPHPPPVSVAEVAKPIVPRQPEEHGFSFSAIKDALIGHSASGSGQPDHPPPVAATQNGHKEPAHNGVSWHEKAKSVFSHFVASLLNAWLVPRFPGSRSIQQARSRGGEAET